VSKVVEGFKRSHCEPSDKIAAVCWESASPGLWTPAHARDQRNGLIKLPHVILYGTLWLLSMVIVPAEPTMTLVLKGIRTAPNKNSDSGSQFIRIILQKDPGRQLKLPIVVKPRLLLRLCQEKFRLKSEGPAYGPFGSQRPSW
jgi:hypothetical protein